MLLCGVNGCYYVVLVGITVLCEWMLLYQWRLPCYHSMLLHSTLSVAMLLSYATQFSMVGDTLLVDELSQRSIS